MPASTPTAAGTVLQRVVFPLGRDGEVLPLYLDEGRGLPGTSAGGVTTVETPVEQHPDAVLGRRRVRIGAGTRTSFAAYFNAFPASYWRRWTTVRQVELRVRLSGPATVLVHRSTASGRSERVDSQTLDPSVDGVQELVFPLSLAPFSDGGWYWFDVAASGADVLLDSADWCAAGGADAARSPERGTATIAITTYNRPSYLVGVLRELAAAPEALEVLDEVLVVDQGTQKVRAQEGFDEVAAALGDRLRVVEQANVGGSGGFSRGMHETLEAGRSRYVLLLDDDVAVEPEGILRGVVFADHCRTPTIVGGHMFNLYARTHLHSFGEVVQPWRFMWGPAPYVEEDHAFDVAGLRSTPWMHRRIDVDYTAWWMCLIPVEVLKTTGFSLPIFIKWDDCEFGLRAGKAGFPSVSLPGMAIWHMPWSDKDDTIDWQAYFHQRNRLVVGLLHSQYARGGRLVRESLTHQVKHVLAMQYSVAELRLRAIEDVLSGPAHLHRVLASKLPEVRALRSGYADAQVASDPTAYPPVRRRRPPRKGRPPEAPRGPLALVLRAAAGVAEQLRPVPMTAVQNPQADVPAIDAAWWRLATLDSALVSTADGTASAWYRRDRTETVDLLRRSLAVHERLLAEWPALSRTYRDALGEVTSQGAWAQTFTELERG